MKRSAGTPILWIAAVALLWPVHSAQGEVVLLGEGSSRYYYCDADGRHIARATLFQMIQGDYDLPDGAPLLFEYNKDLVTPLPDGEVREEDRITAKIAVRRGNRWVKVGKIRGVVHEEADEAQLSAVKLFDVELNAGDVLRWKLRFRNFDIVEEGEQIQILTALIVDPEALE